MKGERVRNNRSRKANCSDDAESRWPSRLSRRQAGPRGRAGEPQTLEPRHVLRKNLSPRAELIEQDPNCARYNSFLISEARRFPIGPSLKLTCKRLTIAAKTSAGRALD